MTEPSGVCPALPQKSRTIGVFTGTRAEYGLLHPIIETLHQSDDFQVALYVSGAHLDAGYGHTIQEIEQDGFPVVWTHPLVDLGRNMAAEAGSLLQALGAQFQDNTHRRPDCFLVLGDRYETLAAGTAAFLSNIPLAHVHGGDVVRGGMLDDPIRHALTKLAHLHFPATPRSAERISRMGEEPWRITVAGSPALDNIRRIPLLDQSVFVREYDLDPQRPWILFTQHPITTEPEQAGAQARQSLAALGALGDRVQLIATYPNHDDGSADIIAALQEAAKTTPSIRLIPSLGRLRYLNLLRYVALVAGNSSSGLLETAHFNVPCLNIGNRQQDRERGGNVMDVPQDAAAIAQAAQAMIFDPETRATLQGGEHPFGTGDCAQRILTVFRRDLNHPHLLQKQLTY